MQRAAVARALAHRPSIVFADEPTGALDSVNSNLVFDALLEHARRVGALLVVVTHEQQLAARCDQIVVLTDGQITDVRYSPATARDLAARPPVPTPPPAPAELG